MRVLPSIDVWEACTCHSKCVLVCVSWLLLLRYIAANAAPHKAAFVSAGALPILVTVLVDAAAAAGAAKDTLQATGPLNSAKHAAGALRNIVGSPEQQTAAAAAGAVGAAVAILDALRCEWRELRGVTRGIGGQGALICVFSVMAALNHTSLGPWWCVWQVAARRSTPDPQRQWQSR
jgi:hypothetical protein